MLRILLHSLVCLLGIGIFSKVISHEGKFQFTSHSSQSLAPPADEFRFFCESFDTYQPGLTIAELSSRWDAHPVDSLNAVVVPGVDEGDRKLAVDSGRVAILNLTQVSLMMDNQFHLEWDLAFQQTGNEFDTIFLSNDAGNFDQAVAIAIRQDSLKFLHQGNLIAGHAWGPDPGGDHFEVYFNTRIDSAFFLLNDERLATLPYSFANLGYMVFTSGSNDYVLDDLCHSVQVPEENCACGIDDWTNIYCNTFEDYFLGPFLSNNTPEWRAYNGPDETGVLVQEDGLNHVMINMADSIGHILPNNLSSKFVYSFQALLEAGVGIGGGGGMRFYLDSARKKEILNLRFRKNASRIESVELRVNRKQLPDYNVQEFKSGKLSDFSILVDTVSWNFNFYHDGTLQHSWALPDSVVNINNDHSLTAVFVGRSGEYYELDNICIQEPPVVNSCQLSPSWEAVFCDNFDTHPLGEIEMNSQKWMVQNPILDKAEIIVPNELEDFNPQLFIPTGGKAQVSFSLNQLNTNRFRVNSFSRLSNPLGNFGGNIFLKNDMEQLIEVRMSDGFFNRTGVVFLYGDTTKMADLPLNPARVEEYDLSFLFDRTSERLEIFYNDQLMLSSDASDSLLIRSFFQKDMILEYQAKQQPMIVEQAATYRRLMNTDACDDLIAAADTCMVAVGDSLYTPSEACILGYLATELVKVETPVVAGLKPIVVDQITAIGGRVEGDAIYINQGAALELFLILDKNSLDLANNLCASFSSIKFAYQGDPLTVDSCSAAFFAWDFFNSEGGVSLTHTISLELETCIELNAVVGIDSSSVGPGMQKSGDFSLMVLANENGDFDLDAMDQVVSNLDYSIDFTTCNDNTQERYILGERIRVPHENGQDTCFKYLLKVELFDEVCGFVVPAQDSFYISILDTLPPTLPPLDTMHFACLDDAFAAAHASLIDTSLVVDNIVGNEDTSRIHSQVYLSNNPSFLEVTKEWTLVDSCGNQGKVFQRFIVDEEPISFTAPDTAYVNRISLIGDTRITGSLMDISSLCGPITDTLYVDDKPTITACRDTVIRTWTAEDSVGNRRSYHQLIIYEDTVDPVLEHLPKVTFNRLSDTTNFAIVGIPKVISDDHPIVDTTFTDMVSDSSRCFARIDRTWRFTDSCGNVAESQQELVFDSRMDPIIVGLKPAVRQQIEATGGTLSGSSVRVSQENVNDLYNLLDANSLLLSNADCSNHEEIDFFYEGEVVPSDTTCAASDFVWRFLDEAGDVTASYALSVDVFSCIEFIAAGDLIAGSVPSGLSFMNDSTLAAQLLNGQAISMNQLDSLVGELEYDIEFTSCNDNAQIRYTSQVREPLPMENRGDPCFRYSFVAEVYDDKCGFLESRPVSVDIVDTLAPSFMAPDTMYFPCLGDAYLAAIPSQINRSLIVDNIRGNEDLASIRDTIYENDSFPFAAVTKRWTISDLCGNTTYAYQHFLVNQEPINLELPDPIVIARFSDLQDTSITGTIQNVFSFCGQVDAISYVDDITTIGGCEETITRRWTVTDNRGNKRVADQIFLYRDTLGPELNPFGITRLDCVEDAANLEVSGIPSLKFDDHPALSFSYTDQVFDSISCLKQIIRSWEVKDPCGNVTETEQTIEIDNRSAPAIVWPPSFVRVNCRPEAEDTTLTGSPFFPDYFCTNTKVTYSDNLVSASPCEVLYQRQWKVRTECGLEVTNSQVIQVKDSIPPTFNPPGPVTVVASDLVRLSATGFPTNIEDNCYVSNSIGYEDEWVVPVSCTDTGLVARSIIVTDQCGNAGRAQQMITVLPLSTPIAVVLDADTVYVPLDAGLIELPTGFPDSGLYSGPFVFENTFNVEEAGEGIYEVFYTIGDPESDCAFSDSVIIVVGTPNATVDPEFLSALTIWPNPTSDQLNIRFDGVDPEPVRIKLWSGTGDLIRTEQIQVANSVWEHRLSLAELPGGVYWISFETAAGYKGYRKVVKF
ncbi:T9SS type A sorting domain-containing protein [Flavilitoribacter nigricans]|uniref:Secretion system C-terminal sorting domain-containing protein n=1 Tax=Flavilitoribacter nigricans (strain ATCC 23147 / DSM 23189 / NBRC 102662 / NCIMB 1420 / SS-2) TaxID=1122177 RepID=A0A2D0NCU0_FLAN2|nr:T9SS type A sorting domain-containing protein [Flavilitoribacter nigricans]PHN06305.1 hypothetical protein CRP01_12085 [Flavilitoribacter nigricans DSM 23189 = NBRC 102662]